MSMTYGKIIKAKDDKGNIYWLSGEKGMPEVDGILLYGWKNYIVENFYKPYQVSLLNLNDEDTKDYRYLGVSMFPTVKEDDTPNTGKYFFGSVRYNDEILYVLLADKDVESVTFYSKNERKEASIDNLSKDKYKIVWFIESAYKLEETLNVMYIGLNDLDMPYRNMTNYLEPINHAPISISDQKEWDVIYDELTGTILANKEVESTPLLNYIKKLNKNSNWNARNTYRCGEKVNCTLSDGEVHTFISLKDWNIGEQPGLSRFWQDENDFGFLKEKHKFYIKVLNDTGEEIKEYPAHFSFRTYTEVSKLSPSITLKDGFYLVEVKGDSIKPISTSELIKKSLESYIRGDRQVNIDIEKSEEEESSAIGEVTLIFLKKAWKSDNDFLKPRAEIRKENSIIKQEPLENYGSPFSISLDLTGYGLNMKSLKKSMYVQYGNASYSYTYDFSYTDWNIDIENQELTIMDTYNTPFVYVYTVEFSSKISASFVGYSGYFVDHISKDIEDGKSTIFKLMPIEEGTTASLKIKVDDTKELLEPGKSITSQGDTIQLSNIGSDGIYTLTIDSGATNNHIFEVI